MGGGLLQRQGDRRERECDPVQCDDGPFRGEAIDPTNPPRYEAQASYLWRHDLLLPGERARLTDADFEPEVVVE
jgi:hypothetical protein